MMDSESRHSESQDTELETHSETIRLDVDHRHVVSSTVESYSMEVLHVLQALGSRLCSVRMLVLRRGEGTLQCRLLCTNHSLIHEEKADCRIQALPQRSFRCFTQPRPANLKNHNESLACHPCHWLGCRSSILGNRSMKKP